MDEELRWDTDSEDEEMIASLSKLVKQTQVIVGQSIVKTLKFDSQPSEKRKLEPNPIAAKKVKLSTEPPTRQEVKQFKTRLDSLKQSISVYKMYCKNAIDSSTREHYTDLLKTAEKDLRELNARTALFKQTLDSE